MSQEYDRLQEINTFRNEYNREESENTVENNEDYEEEEYNEYEDDEDDTDYDLDEDDEEPDNPLNDDNSPEYFQKYPPHPDRYVHSMNMKLLDDIYNCRLNLIQKDILLGADINFRKDKALLIAIINRDVTMIILLIALGSDVNARYETEGHFLELVPDNTLIEDILLNANSKIRHSCHEYSHFINKINGVITISSTPELPKNLIPTEFLRLNKEMERVSAKNNPINVLLLSSVMSNDIDEISEKLIAGADINFDGSIVLVTAVKMGSVEMVTFLLDAGADIFQNTPTDNYEPIVYSVLNDDIDVTTILLNSGSNPQFTKIGNLTELDNISIEIMLLLVQYGTPLTPKSLLKINSYQSTYPNMIGYFQKYLDRTRRFIPRVYINRSYSRTVFKPKLEYPYQIIIPITNFWKNILTESMVYAIQGNDVNVIDTITGTYGRFDSFRSYPLIQAVLMNKADIVDRLIQRGADVNILNGLSLRSAVDVQNNRIIGLLVRAGVNIDANNYIALATAERKRNQGIINFLIENGATPIISYDNNRTFVKYVNVIPKQAVYVNNPEEPEEINENSIISENSPINRCFKIDGNIVSPITHESLHERDNIIMFYYPATSISPEVIHCIDYQNWVTYLTNSATRELVDENKRYIPGYKLFKTAYPINWMSSSFSMLTNFNTFYMKSLGKRDMSGNIRETVYFPVPINRAQFIQPQTITFNESTFIANANDRPTVLDTSGSSEITILPNGQFTEREL
jgi:hypothetical protein